MAQYSYESGTNRLQRLDYGNGDRVQYTYDSQGRLITETYEDGETVSYAYDNVGNLATVTDSETGIVTTYYYDLLNRQSGYREIGTGLNHSVTYEYDADNNLASMTETLNGTTTTYTYTYDDDNRIVSETVDGVTVEYSYDGFGRLESRVVKQGDFVVLSSTPTYSAGAEAGTTTGQISSYNGFTYTYDDNGNILTVSDGTNTTRYEYDSANQLIREDNELLDVSYTWEYDASGNIINRGEYSLTTGTLGDVQYDLSYEYTDESWGDLLTFLDGDIFSYDEIGNPLDDGNRTYTWQHGRQLASMSNGKTTWNYTYDANGLRTKRTDGTHTYTYVYNGSLLTRMTVGSDTFYFTYDASGTPLTVSIGTMTYYYVTNLQGDVIGILNSSGEQLVTYAYDAWGNVSVLYYIDQIVDYNPLLYRGYVYDWETGLYYLQSRYYNPRWGRFINADSLVSTGQGFIGNNMFAYCNNNPIIFIDKTGTVFALVTLICFAVATIVAVDAIFVVAAMSTLAEILVEPILDLGTQCISLIDSTATAVSTLIFNPQPIITYARPEETIEVYEYSYLAKTHTTQSRAKTHVHHIVPVGNFLNRSKKIRGYMYDLHDAFIKAEINILYDPMNLMLVSAGYHAILHTDEYITYVHRVIMSAGESKEEIYAALFYLRIEIAGFDKLGLGF